MIRDDDDGEGFVLQILYLRQNEINYRINYTVYFGYTRLNMIASTLRIISTLCGWNEICRVIGSTPVSAGSMVRFYLFFLSVRLSDDPLELKFDRCFAIRITRGIIDLNPPKHSDWMA
jgi:hypothetical protein